MDVSDEEVWCECSDEEMYNPGKEKKGTWQPKPEDILKLLDEVKAKKVWIVFTFQKYFVDRKSVQKQGQRPINFHISFLELMCFVFNVFLAGYIYLVQNITIELYCCLGIGHCHKK